MTPSADQPHAELILAAAVAYVRRGLSIFPLWGTIGPICGCPRGAECKDQGKHPVADLVPNGLKNATRDEATIREWFTPGDHPPFNIGVAYGPGSQLWILDVDGEEGRNSLKRFEELNGPLPETPLVRTGRDGGGEHRLFRWPAGGRVVGNAKGGQGRMRDWPGLDVRGQGGYGILPPSRHKTGRLYEWASEGDAPGAPEALLDLVCKKTASPSISPPAGHRPREVSERQRKWALSALTEEAAILAAKPPESGRNNLLNTALVRLLRMAAGGLIDADVVISEMRSAAEACECPGIEATIRSAIEGARRYPPILGPDDDGSLPPPSVRHELREAGLIDDHTAHVRWPRFPMTDVGNGRRIAHHHGADLRYTMAHGWFAWDGRRWRHDDAGVAERKAKGLSEIILEEARRIRSPKARERQQKWAEASEFAKVIAAALQMARTEPPIIVRASELDRDPYLLNVENGTLDLRTGSLRPHDRSDLITKLAPVVHDPDATCPRFLEFLDRIMAGRQDVIDYLRRLAGMTLTGDVGEEVVPFLWGGGANGKSTYTAVFRRLLGDYAGPAPPDLLTLRSMKEHPTELADLEGLRMVTVAEIGPGSTFNVQRMKALSGGEPIKGRKMRKDFYWFMPTHKTWISANHRPSVPDTTNSIWRRLHLIPFTVQIPKGERIRGYADVLWEERSGILNWALQGCREWRENGLQPPEAVSLATEAYRRQENVVGRFVDERCVRGDALKAPATPLFEAFREWVKRTAVDLISQKEFGESLTELGFHNRKYGKANRSHWFGLGLLDDGPDGGKEEPDVHGGGGLSTGGRARQANPSAEPDEASQSASGQGVTATGVPKANPANPPVAFDPSRARVRHGTREVGSHGSMGSPPVACAGCGLEWSAKWVAGVCPDCGVPQGTPDSSTDGSGESEPPATAPRSRPEPGAAAGRSADEVGPHASNGKQERSPGPSPLNAESLHLCPGCGFEPFLCECRGARQSDPSCDQHLFGRADAGGDAEVNR